MSELESRIRYAFQHAINFLELTLSEYKEVRRMIAVCPMYGTWKIMSDVYFDEADKEEVLSGRAVAYLIKRDTKQEILITVVRDDLARIGSAAE